MPTTNNSLRVFVVDDDREMRQSLTQFLSRSGCDTRSYASGREALSSVATQSPDVVVSDIRMPGMSGLDLLRSVGALHRSPPVLLITAHGDVPMAVEAMKAGAFDFIEKPFQPERLLDAIRRAAEFGRLRSENAILRERLRRLSGLDAILVGECAAMRRVREEVEDIATTDAAVLILGETGTGKELVARALHDLSPRAGNPFVAVNCATLAATTFDSKMFGEEGGVQGTLAEANTGTLFLDELLACPPDVQAKLLRVIETREFTPAPTDKPRHVEFRVLSASNEEMDTALADGRFREDLYYRLNTVILGLPPLRDRAEDIALLFAHFARQYAELYEIAAPETTSEDLASLMSHSWPGNVRELRHVAERRILAARCGRGSVQEAIKPDGEHEGVPATLREAVAAFERQLIGKAIQTHRGRMDAVAEALGIGRRTLNEKIVKLGLNKNEFL